MPTFSYDETHPTPEDRVKFYLRQTASTKPPRDFSDEEISAVFSTATLRTERANVYWTAADMLSALVVGYASSGKGRDKGKVGRLEITFGGRSTKLEELRNLVALYEKKAAFYSRVKPRPARLLNASGQRRQ